MPVQREARREFSASRDTRWPRRRAASRLLRIITFILFILGPSLAARTEEIGARLSPSLATLSLNLALFSSRSSVSLNQREQMLRLSFDSRFSTSLKDLAVDRESGNNLSKSLLRKQLVWINEGPRTKIRPGFGEFFRGETVEPLRCNGAGVEDSRYLYVKLSFKF